LAGKLGPGDLNDLLNGSLPQLLSAHFPGSLLTSQLVGALHVLRILGNSDVHYEYNGRPYDVPCSSHDMLLVLTSLSLFCWNHMLLVLPKLSLE
jgi:hypothetical protein